MKMLSEEEKLKNIRIIKEEIMKELDEEVEFTEHEIHNIYDGLAGFFIRPIARLIYIYIAEESVLKNAEQQLEVLCDCAKNCTEENIEKIVDENFERYLLHDEVYLRANHRHPKIDILIDFLKNAFRAQLHVLARLVNSHGDTYEELVRNVMTKEEAKEEMFRHLNYAEEGLKIVESEYDILNIPVVIRHEVLKLLKLGYEHMKEKVAERIEEIYSKQI